MNDLYDIALIHKPEWRYETRPAPTELPHKCPVCEGTGLRPNGFYGQEPGTNDVPCRSCDKGVIWR